MSSVADVPSTIVAPVLLKWKMPMTLGVANTVLILACTIRGRLCDTDAPRPTFPASKNTSRSSTLVEAVTLLFLDNQGLPCLRYSGGSRAC